MYLLISISLVLYGFLEEKPEPIAMGGIVFFFTYSIQKYFKEGVTSINPVTLYSLIKGMASMGNLAALIYVNDPQMRPIYFKYVAHEYIVLAMLLHFFGSLLTIFGFEKALSIKGNLPKLHFPLSSHQLSVVFPRLSFLILLLVSFNLIPSLGAVSNLIKFIPIASVFFLARIGASNDENKYVKLAFFLMIATTFQAILYSYLRMNIVLPAIAFVLGLLIGKRSIGVLKRPILYPVYAGAFLFITYFTFIGNNRSEIGSGLQRLEKIQQLAEEDEENEESDEDEQSTMLSRFSNINQLSQIGRVAAEDGYYQGTTLNYLIFGFIPRIVWPDKPLIQQGAWFATRIGMGRLYEGRYTNSIDMTATGELYLNFGWIGVVIGSILLGFFIGSLWLTSLFWKIENNITGNLFGFYLLYLGLFSFGADLQIILTLIAVYIIFILFDKWLGRNASNIEHN